MIPVIVLRPQPGCDRTVAAARARGLDARGYPLFAVEPRAWEAPAPDSFDALLIGSGNALRQAGDALHAYPGKPAYAVGATTARAAAAARLEVVATGSGGLQSVLARLRPEHRRLLRLAGEARIALDLPAGCSMVERVVYASEPLAMAPELAALLASPILVLLHSAEAARHFASECARLCVDRSRIAIAALGERIADAAGQGWGALAWCGTPDEPALLALAARMCQEADQPSGTMHAR